MSQPNRDGPYGLQPLANIARSIVESGCGTNWAEIIHAQMSVGALAPNNEGRDRKLRAMFKAIRLLEQGDAKQQRKARELGGHLEHNWGLKHAYVTAGEGDLEATRALRERWGDGQLPPIDGGFVDGIAADEALIGSIIRRLK
jgi:hypothetical protein